MVVTLTQAVGEGLRTLWCLQIFQPKPCKLPKVLTYWAPSARHPGACFCLGTKTRLVERTGKGGKWLSSKVQGEAARGLFGWHPSSPTSLQPPWFPPDPQQISAGWLWRWDGHYYPGAGYHISQLCILELEWRLCWKAGRDGLKMPSSNVSNAGKLGREQVARTHIWKSFMAIICHHLKPRIMSIITRRYTWAQRITVFSRIVVTNPIVGRA